MVPRHPSCARIRLTEKKRISPGPGVYVAILYTQKLCSFQGTTALRRPAMRGPRISRKTGSGPTSEPPARGAVGGRDWNRTSDLVLIRDAL